MLEDLQFRIKTSSTSLALLAFRLISGMAVALTLALILGEMLQSGSLVFLFVIVSVTAAFLRLSRAWSFMGVAVFDLICILIGLLLRMYILVAPGS